MAQLSYAQGGLLILVLVTIFSAISVEARPLVRNIKDQKEFETLLKHHAKNTGLPVVADFYSESCGPCRMMAPIFKKVAKEYEGRAVFVKVDTARNRQLQSTYRVNSIPTFIFFADGKRKKDFAGAGEHQLKQYTREIVAEAEKLNVRLTSESLNEFYEKYDSSKSENSIKELYNKCAKMSNSDYCEGGPATDLTMKLYKKYKSKPILSKKIFSFFIN
jgi:thioredoxin